LEYAKVETSILKLLSQTILSDGPSTLLGNLDTVMEQMAYPLAIKQWKKKES
jgi:hypothetical protein